MPAKNTFKYIISILLLFMYASSSAQLAESDDDSSTKPRIDLKGLHQLCVAVDIAQPISCSFAKNRRCYEAAIDYYLGKEIYGLLEGGFGNATSSYTDLEYKSNNVFFRAGINKSILLRLDNSDWDMGFIGVRYGFAAVNRGAGTYTIVDNIYGNTSGTIPAKSIQAHWAEIAGGMRVAVLKDICAGWTIRGKFLLNAKAFNELAPSFIAGYGKGDKGSVFDYNFYISYPIRWGKKTVKAPRAVVPAPVTK